MPMLCEPLSLIPRLFLTNAKHLFPATPPRLSHPLAWMVRVKVERLTAAHNCAKRVCRTTRWRDRHKSHRGHASASRLLLVAALPAQSLLGHCPAPARADRIEVDEQAGAGHRKGLLAEPDRSARPGCS